MEDSFLTPPFDTQNQLPESILSIVDYMCEALNSLFLSTFQDPDGYDSYLSTDIKYQDFKLTVIKQYLKNNLDKFSKSFNIFLKRYLFNNDHINLYGNKIRRASSQGTVSFEHLSLMNDHQMNDLILIMSYAKKLRRRNAFQLECISKRIAYLLPESKASLENNPIDPQNYFSAFSAACNALHFGTFEKKYLFCLFDMGIGKRLSSLFKHINQKFVAFNVLPQLEKQVVELKRKPVFKAPASLYQNPVDNGLKKDEVISTHIMSHYLQVHHQLSSKKLRERKFPVKLNYQRLLEEEFSRHSLSFSPYLMTDREKAILQKVDAFFDALFQNTVLTIPVKTQVARLQIVLVIFALREPKLLSTHEHPIRKLLSTIFSLGVDWMTHQDQEHIGGKAIMRAIDSLVAEFFNQGNAMENAKNILQEAELKFQSGDIIRKRMLQVQTAKQSTQEGYEIIAKTIHPMFVDSFASKGLHFFVRNIWVPWMLLTYFRQGTRSTEWKSHIQRLSNLLTPLKKRTKAASSIALQNERQTIIDYAQELGSLIGLPTKTKSQLHDLLSAKKIAIVDRYCNEYHHCIEGPDIRLSYKISSFLLRIESGTWIEFVDDNGRKIRGIYACFSEDTNQLVFINRCGKPVLEANKPQVDQWLGSKQLHVLDHTLAFSPFAD